MTSNPASPFARARRLACASAIGVALAGGGERAHASELVAAIADLSLEQLSDIVVISVSRRAQPLADAPASVYVITADDIRRSGVRSLPEALRLAPNLQVARADANQYAITARGFGNVLSNKLLVMIDGRVIFSPLFSGVFWETHDVMLEDVERIEVLDGPESTVWGTNAVNGVINVITKNADATQGALVAAGGGNADWDAAVRYGGRAAGGHYRLYARALGLDDTHRADGSSAGDASNRARAGFRYDSATAREALTVQGDAYRGDIGQGPGAQRDVAGLNLLARWQRILDGGAVLSVQSYYDRTELEQADFREHLDTLDVDAQVRFDAGARHAILAGAGYRFQRDRVRNSPTQAFLPPDRDLDTWYLLVQDEFSASDSVSIIGGIKLEHNDYTGAEYLPSVRLRWQASRDHTLWAALSHTARAPSRIDRELFVPGTPPFVIEGGPGFRSEVADVVEAGWRGRAGPAFAWSVTAFRHEHERLRSVEPAPDGGFVLANGLEGSTSGLEGWATFHASERWRLSAGGIELRQRLRAAPGVVDVGGLAALGNDPKRSYVFRSSLDFANRQELDVIVRYVGERPNPTVPAYTAVDLRWGWHVNDRTELSLTIDNLTDAEHAEWGPPANRVEFERSWFLKLVVRL